MKQAHPLQRRVQNFIHQEQLISSKDSLLIAVSGGPDSVALLHVLVFLRNVCGIGQMSVLHFDHQLRGGASSEERDFVEELAKTFELSFHAGSADVRLYQQNHRISLEMAARACRHRFFKEALNQLQATKIALGHTANDQAEEILLRLFRGTGPSGLSGMPPKTAAGHIRPLLFATREEILTYLQDQKLTFREDLSNRDVAHKRNAVRHKILPAIEDHFHPRVVNVLCRNARLVEDEESCWKELLADRWPRFCVSETPSRIEMRCQDLLDCHPAFRRRLLRFGIERLQRNLQGIHAVHIESLCRLLASRISGKSIQLPGALCAVIEGGVLVLSRYASRRNECPFSRPQSSPRRAFGRGPRVCKELDSGQKHAGMTSRNGYFILQRCTKESSRGSLPDAEGYSQIMGSPGVYQFFSWEFRLSLVGAPSPADTGWCRQHPDTVWLDAGAIRWPLFLRFWQSGDRFHPLGLRGSKKLQDFFVDCKVPRSQRGRVPLLCDEEKICWVVGHRLDDRVKVTPQTEQILVIEKSSFIAAVESGATD